MNQMNINLFDYNLYKILNNNSLSVSNNLDSKYGIITSYQTMFISFNNFFSKF